ncbi:hypothetical protein KDL01_14375 [Actinospica durhamensis]|uniref:Band 7 domain-containing protein n=1 Tax=Actinospica durhamensis TaxID=1508375 RepID=A0A941EQ24_9ACTN|nr:SPFH domain-containing protein [Actinospica durhamensis]MBR7834457.1 hypothetical protein [Actinospica durhamensis]
MSTVSVPWTVESVTKDGVGLQLKGVAVVTLPPPRRFGFAKRPDVDERVRDIVCRHLRAVLGSMSAQDVIIHRGRLIGETLAGSLPEVEQLGAQLSEIVPQAVDFDEESEFAKQLKLAQTMPRARPAQERPGD